MAYKITDDCISCGVCAAECPNQAISEGETVFVIDSEKCTECVGAHESSKCAEVCPVDACVPDPEHQETHDQLLDKWQKMHPGGTPNVS
ncbi:MAG: YfhL family 4Fe-4S dicluster ferredoxin [Dehalococcoidia bacterium]|nr:YfhL family 4Fe-4S dicluster ferredoxin [Dehalococcoidia bacterium]